MVRNVHSQQVRVDIAELVAETFLGHVPGETSIIFVHSTKDPSANNILLYGLTRNTANLFEEALTRGRDQQRLKDITEGA